MSPLPAPVALPASLGETAFRGMRGKCPRCGEAHLFRKWLKPVDRCSGCGQDWSLQRADDIPPYISIFVTGHLIAPVLILLLLDYHLSTFAASMIIVPLAIGIMLGVLQPAKGAVIAVQWWLGLNGFKRERPLAVDGSDTP